MSNRLPIAVNKGDKTNLTGLTKRDGFTTNKNYLGHNEQGIPYYYDPHLKEEEIKYIMTNEFKKLNDGTYEAKVEQVIRKHGKTPDGEEDTSKDIISLELNVKGETDRFYYINFCVNGYGEQQTQYAKDDIDRLMKEFNVLTIDELAGKEGILSAKTKPDGNSAMYFNAPRVFLDGGTVLQFDCEARFPCDVTKFYSKGTKKIFIVKANVNGTIAEEFVVYDLSNDMKKESYEGVLSKLSLAEQDINIELVDKKAFLVVKRITKDGKIYFNKRLGFEKKQPRKPKAG